MQLISNSGRIWSCCCSSSKSTKSHSYSSRAWRRFQNSRNRVTAKTGSGQQHRQQQQLFAKTYKWFWVLCSLVCVSLSFLDILFYSYTLLVFNNILWQVERSCSRLDGGGSLLKRFNCENLWNRRFAEPNTHPKSPWIWQRTRFLHYQRDGIAGRKIMEHHKLHGERDILVTSQVAVRLHNIHQCVKFTAEFGVNLLNMMIWHTCGSMDSHKYKKTAFKCKLLEIHLIVKHIKCWNWETFFKIMSLFWFGCSYTSNNLIILACCKLTKLLLSFSVQHFLKVFFYCCNSSKWAHCLLYLYLIFDLYIL